MLQYYIVIVAKPCQCTKNYWNVHFKGGILSMQIYLRNKTPQKSLGCYASHMTTGKAYESKTFIIQISSEKIF